MLIMPANNKSGLVHYWAGRLPGSIGHLWTPGSNITTYPWIPFSIDNGEFEKAMKGETCDPEEFADFCQYACSQDQLPIWIVVPDRYKSKDETLERWKEWAPQLRKHGVPLAFVIQNGMTPQDVPDDADMIFVGGTDDWRYPRLDEFLKLGKPIHVGRVNGNNIWNLHNKGITSCDGSGWFRGDRKQLGKLERYLLWRAGEPETHINQMMAMPDDGIKYFYTVGWEHLIAPKPKRVRIPDNIKRDHLITAIRNWNGTPLKHRGTKFLVLHENQTYPTKLLIARANWYANGQIWPTYYFSGGIEANTFLTKRGFKVESLETLLQAC